MSKREDFEDWMKTLDGFPFAGSYANLMWLAWQAATSKPVELPEYKGEGGDGFVFKYGYDLALVRSIKAIKAAGYPVKGE